MVNRDLARALVVASLMLSGCVVEPAPNAPPAANGGAGGVESRAGTGNHNAPEKGTGPENAGGQPTPAQTGGKLEAYVRAAAADLAPEQREALARVGDEARRLLALRGYLRAGGGAMSRWAWSGAQVESYQKSPEYAAALVEVEKVRREFASSNPGYTLRVNTEVRSLEEQLSKWNEAESVARAGEELLARAREEVAAPAYAEPPGGADVQRFEGFLRGFTPRGSPTLAAPGLSPHGQLRAFDFQVMQGAQLVAGTSAASAAEVWDASGWTTRLQEAVRRASAKFAGPLASPREPWHYDYRP